MANKPGGSPPGIPFILLRRTFRKHLSLSHKSPVQLPNRRPPPALVKIGHIRPHRRTAKSLLFHVTNRQSSDP